MYRFLVAPLNGHVLSRVVMSLMPKIGAYIERVYSLRYYGLFLFLLQVYPAIYYYNRIGALPFPGEFVYQSLSLLAWTSFLLFICALCSLRVVRLGVQWLVGLVYAGWMLFECFLVFSYNSLYTDSIALNMLASNPEEGKAFVENLNYKVFMHPIGALIGISILCILLSQFLAPKLKPAGRLVRNGLSAMGLVFVLLFFIVVLPVHISVGSYLYMSPLDRLRVGTTVCLHDAKEIEVYLERAKEVDLGEIKQEVNLDSVNVVVLIGESMRKDYMHCYGYPLENTPAQDSLIATGDMVRFSDVIASAAWTTGSVSSAMTFYREGGTNQQWYQYPTLPMVMSRAGYYSYWVSNHERQGNAVQPVSTIAATADSTIYAKTRALGDWNSAMDLELLKFLPKKNIVPQGKKALFQVVHLIGSHTPYAGRSNREFGSFTTNDLPATLPNGMPTPKSEAKRAVLRDYVNSIRYNDEVVRRIVAHFSDKPTLLVYFSDHGQALYENPDKPDYYEHEVSRQGLSIPLLVYMSPSLRKMHPEIYDRIVKAKDRKIMNDLFSNSLCGLLGIRLKYYEPEYDYFSDEYNNNRVRSVIGYNGKPMTF